MKNFLNHKGIRTCIIIVAWLPLLIFFIIYSDKVDNFEIWQNVLAFVFLFIGILATPSVCIAGIMARRKLSVEHYECVSAEKKKQAAILIERETEQAQRVDTYYATATRLIKIKLAGYVKKEFQQQIKHLKKRDELFLFEGEQQIFAARLNIHNQYIKIGYIGGHVQREIDISKERAVVKDFETDGHGFTAVFVDILFFENKE